jgi:mannose-6-phosphate isomerase-like protein (cupin superfamily)
MTTQGFILEPQGGRVFLAGRGRVKVEPGTADFTVFENTILTNPTGVPLHVHHRDDEAFYVLEGELEFVVGNNSGRCHSGCFVMVPRNMPHRFANHGPEPARVLIIGSPRIQALVEEIAPLLDINPPDIATALAAFARYESEILRP